MRYQAALRSDSLGNIAMVTAGDKRKQRFNRKFFEFSLALALNRAWLSGLFFSLAQDALYFTQLNRQRLQFIALLCR